MSKELAWLFMPSYTTQEIAWLGLTSYPDRARPTEERAKGPLLGSWKESGPGSPLG